MTAALDLAWQKDAACRGLDPAPFHRDRNLGGDELQQTRALCAGCPVRDECLAHALEYPESYGIWGGLTARERYRRRRNMPNSAACIVCGDAFHRHSRSQVACGSAECNRVRSINRARIKRGRLPVGLYKQRSRT